MNKNIVQERKKKVNLLIDLGIIFLFYPLALPLFLIFGEYINNNSNFISILLLSMIEFIAAGLGVFFVIYLRKEHLSDYGIKREGIKISVGIGLLFAIVMIVLKSIDAGELVYFPMRNHTVTECALNLKFPLNIIGIIITLTIWGVIEGFYYVVIIKKIDDIFSENINPWLSAAPIAFFVYDFTMHYCIRVFIEQRTYEFSVVAIVIDIVLAYAMFIPRKMTGNASGSLLYQTLQNGIGRL